MSQVTQAEVTRVEIEDLKQRVHEVEQAEIQLRRQAVGPRGPQGPTGLKGDAGPQGPTGASGRDGGEW
jgi:hypothetical protein